MTDIPKGDFKVTVESAAKIQGMNSPPPPGTTVIPGSVAKVTPIPLKYANPAKSSIDVHVPIKQEKLEIKLD